jgi:hypothetical protein
MRLGVLLSNEAAYEIAKVARTPPEEAAPALRDLLEAAS